jgi:protoporphyrinogen oxidase
MSIYVLGGGPTGLALVDGLSEQTKEQFILIEKESSLGGLARTICWEDCSHDLGPHKIFSVNKVLVNKVLALLPEEEWLSRPKYSSIYINGKFISYPPSPFVLAGALGLTKFMEMSFGFAVAKAKSLISKREVTTFEEDLINRVGVGLYETLFKPIALKLWGNPKNLDSKLSKGRVQIPSVSEILGRMFGLKKTSNFEALEFNYPKGGLIKLWDSIYMKTRNQGTFLLNTEITKITLNNNKVRAISYRDCKSGKVSEFVINEDDFIFSTLPLQNLMMFMENDLDDELLALSKKMIQLNDLILVFLKIDRERLFNESWVFVPDNKIIFHRISEQSAFDPMMTLGHSIICCEIMINEMRNVNTSDQSIVEETLRGLAKMGYKDFDVIDTRVIRLPASYPVFRPGYNEALKKIIDKLDSVSNFRTIGRQGAFNYVGTLDAMDIGYGAATWMLSRLVENEVETWRKERIRTSFYPVLD